MSRRNFLKSVGLSTGGLLLSPAMRAAQARNPLQIQERHEGITTNSRVTYSLRAQKGSTEFIPGLQTPTIGINRSYLGPTLILKRGDDVELDVHNALS